MIQELSHGNRKSETWETWLLYQQDKLWVWSTCVRRTSNLERDAYYGYSSMLLFPRIRVLSRLWFRSDSSFLTVAVLDFKKYRSRRPQMRATSKSAP
jgi:hypothetical protein